MNKLRFTIALLAALSLSLWAWAPAQAQSVGPTNSILCNLVAQMPAGPTGLTQIIPLSTGKSIFICGWHTTNTGPTGTFAFSYGTGSNCGSGTQPIMPATNVTSSAPSADHIDFATMQTPPSQAFCINPSVATISAIVYYSQF